MITFLCSIRVLSCPIDKHKITTFGLQSRLLHAVHAYPSHSDHGFERSIFHISRCAFFISFHFDLSLLNPGAQSSKPLGFIALKN